MKAIVEIAPSHQSASVKLDCLLYLIPSVGQPVVSDVQLVAQQRHCRSAVLEVHLCVHQPQGTFARQSAPV